ncbi:NUDIX hydrolase [Verrucomicrobiota bacterium]
MTETTVRSETVFSGRLLKVEVLEVEMESGRRASREIVRHPGAAVILPELPDGRFVLVRQFRKPVERFVLEAVAGVLEPGEDPDDCAVREVREETGYCVAELRKLGVILPSPGYTEEKLHVYHASLGAEPGDVCPDEDEHIEIVVLSSGQIDSMVSRGELQDAKSLATWLLYKTAVSSERVTA